MIKLTNQFCQSWLNNKDISDTAHNKDTMKCSAELCFTYWNDLVYYINNINDYEHLCIFICFKKKLFELVYNWQHYDDFYHTYNQIFSSLFIQYLIKQLKIYIQHCSECKINQMTRYILYESLHSILTLSISFYIIIMNFILMLSSDN